MYILAIGWLYVTLLVAVNEPTFFSGLISFAFYGALPIGLMLWFSGSRQRRARLRAAESLPDQVLDERDRGHAGTDQ